MFTVQEISLLNALQYELPLTEAPFTELADNLELPQDFVLERIEEFRLKGVIKRIGANLNYKAFKSTNKAALIGAAVEESRIEEVSRIINRTKPKHNFWREHDIYNIWFTLKAKDENELLAKIKQLMEKCKVSEYIILPTKRVYKMDVKYDLSKGISWSTKEVEPASIPCIDDLGINAEMLRKLEKLTIEKRPFKRFKQYGYSEAEIVDLIDELIGKGVVRDFSGVLSERRIGINENGMTVLKVKNTEKIAIKLIENFPEITHLIERVVPDNWEYPLYFMVHASSKKPIEEIRERVLEYDEVNDAKILYSKMDLKDFGV